MTDTRRRLEALHKRVAQMLGEIATILAGNASMPVLTRSLLTHWGAVLETAYLEIDALLKEDRQRREGKQ